MEKILVPTDFSACAENAVDVALEIAARTKAQIYFQHLYLDQIVTRHFLEANSNQEVLIDSNSTQTQAKSKLDELVNRAARLGLEAFPLLVVNKGNDKIENYIEPLGIELVIMGSHGAKGFREFVIGSQTQHVVRAATCPVLVVKHKPDLIRFTSILYASTFHEEYDNSLKIPVQLVSLWDGTIHLLYVGVEDDQQTKEEIEKKMNTIEKTFSDGLFTHNFITTNDPEWGIKHVVREINPDAVALTTQLKTNAFLFSHSLAETLANHESFHVLTINSQP